LTSGRGRRGGQLARIFERIPAGSAWGRGWATRINLTGPLKVRPELLLILAERGE